MAAKAAKRAKPTTAKAAKATAKAKPASKRAKPTAAKAATAIAKAKSSKTTAAEKTKSDNKVTVDRRARAGLRRTQNDRRKKSEPVVAERRIIERRVKVNRRRQIDPTTCERDYTGEELEFMNAMDDYKRTSGRMFPTCSEVLEVIRGLGYGKLPTAEENIAEENTAEESTAEENTAKQTAAEENTAEENTAAQTDVVEQSLQTEPHKSDPSVDLTSVDADEKELVGAASMSSSLGLGDCEMTEKLVF